MKKQQQISSSGTSRVPNEQLSQPHLSFYGNHKSDSSLPINEAIKSYHDNEMKMKLLIAQLKKKTKYHKEIFIKNPSWDYVKDLELAIKIMELVIN